MGSAGEGRTRLGTVLLKPLFGLGNTGSRRYRQEAEAGSAIACFKQGGTAE